MRLALRSLLGIATFALGIVAVAAIIAVLLTESTRTIDFAVDSVADQTVSATRRVIESKLDEAYDYLVSLTRATKRFGIPNPHNNVSNAKYLNRLAFHALGDTNPLEGSPFGLYCRFRDGSLVSAMRRRSAAADVQISLSHNAMRPSAVPFERDDIYYVVRASYNATTLMQLPTSPARIILLDRTFDNAQFWNISKAAAFFANNATVMSTIRMPPYYTVVFVS
jgi:hypothetical protein